MRNVLLEALGYVLLLGAIVLAMVLCRYFLWPTTADSVWSIAFYDSGGLLMVATIIVLIAGVVRAYMATR